MRKVMLVIDEIQQLVGLETFLRRLGFDVLSLGKDSLVSDALLGFQPEIIIVSHIGRNVDGLKVAQKVRKAMVPPPRIALSYSGTPPVLTKDHERLVDALFQIPAAGENAIRLLAQLAGLNADPLLDKYRKFASVKLTKDEEIVIIQGGPFPQTTAQQVAAAGSVGRGSQTKSGIVAGAQTARTKGYDTFLENHAKDLANGAADKVMPRARANELMAKLKEDSKTETDVLEEIQAQKIKFAEALFQEDEKKKK